MNRFVRVEARPFPEVLYAHCADGSLRVRLGHGPAASARPASATSLRVRPGSGGRRRPASVIDEHLVVDPDTCRDASLLDCADVLQAGRARSVAGARRRLAELLSAHPACGLAAVPLIRRGGRPEEGGDGVDRAGGWALACGAYTADAGLVVVACRSTMPSAGAVHAEQSLLPSCLHAWLVAGRALREWPYAREAPLPR